MHWHIFARVASSLLCGEVIHLDRETLLCDQFLCLPFILVFSIDSDQSISFFLHYLTLYLFTSLYKLYKLAFYKLVTLSYTVFAFSFVAVLALFLISTLVTLNLFTFTQLTFNHFHFLIKSQRCLYSSWTSETYWYFGARSGLHRCKISFRVTDGE